MHDTNLSHLDAVRLYLLRDILVDLLGYCEQHPLLKQIETIMGLQGGSGVVMGSMAGKSMHYSYIYSSNRAKTDLTPTPPLIQGRG